MSTLPLELVDSIVQNLSGDTQTLKSCSLAAPIFREPCQKRLLTHLELDDSAHKSPAKRSFSEAEERLKESPHLRKYISRLEIALRSDASRASVLAAPLVLGRLTRVTTATVTCTIGSWRELPHGLKSAFWLRLSLVGNSGSGTLRHLFISHLSSRSSPAFYKPRRPSFSETSLSSGIRVQPRPHRRTPFTG